MQQGLRQPAARCQATILGSPAVIKKGKGISLTAEGFDLILADGRLREARSRGPAVAEFEAWHIEVNGPVLFDGKVVRIRSKTTIVNRETKLSATAGRVELFVEEKDGVFGAKRLEAGGGVVVKSQGKTPATVTADGLTYAVGSRRVDVFGSARVQSKGWPANLRFKRVVFLLTDDGIDLKRASDIEVRRKP